MTITASAADDMLKAGMDPDRVATIRELLFPAATNAAHMVAFGQPSKGTSAAQIYFRSLAFGLAQVLLGERAKGERLLRGLEPAFLPPEVRIPVALLLRNMQSRFARVAPDGAQVVGREADRMSQLPAPFTGSPPAPAHAALNAFHRLARGPALHFFFSVWATATALEHPTDSAVGQFRPDREQHLAAAKEHAEAIQISQSFAPDPDPRVDEYELFASGIAALASGHLDTGGRLLEPMLDNRHFTREDYEVLARVLDATHQPMLNGAGEIAAGMVAQLSTQMHLRAVPDVGGPEGVT